MLKTVTTYLLQKKNCALPHIGSFKIHNKPAEYQSEQNQMLPPHEQVVFTADEESKPDADLIAYISKKKNLDTETVALYLKNYCEEWRTTVLRGSEVRFRSLGTLQKNDEGNIIFQPDVQPVYRYPVHTQPLKEQTKQTADQPAETPVAVADTNTGIEYFNTEEETGLPANNNSWWIVAVILLLIAVSAIGYYFYEHGISLKQ